MKLLTIKGATTNGKKCECAMCGRTLKKAEAKLACNTFGTNVFFCEDCTDGDFKTTKSYRNFSGQATSKESETSDHIIKVVCTNPFSALEAMVDFGWTCEILENGDYLLTSELQHSCYQGGHYFGTDEMLVDGFQFFTVNGTECKNRYQYHVAVNAQTTHDKVRV